MTASEEGYSFDDLFDPAEYLYFLESTLAAEDTPKQCDFIEAVLRLDKGAKVLDLGCGHGRHAIELAARGHDVLGVDLVEGFLDVAMEAAKKRDIKLGLVHGDARGFQSDAVFDGVVCLFDAFGYFGDDGDEQVLLNMFAALVPGGRLLLDLRPREILGRMPAVSVLDKGNGDMMIDRHQFDVETGRLVDRRTYVRDGRARTVAFSVRLYTFTEMRRLLQLVGFEIAGFYAGYDLAASPPNVASTRMLILARKPL